MSLKDLIKDNFVYFESYRQGIFTYTIPNKETGLNEFFQVPLDDIGDATLLVQDKAIYFMRWIRKSRETKNDNIF